MEISRNLLAGALSALGKLVSRTSPVEAYRSVLIEGKENKISFRTAGNEETVTFTVDCDNAGEFRVVVNFDAFRTAVKAGKNKTVVLDPDPESLVVDNTLLMAAHVEWSKIGGTTENAATAELPENFVGSLATVAPIVNRSEPRRALQGIHLCPEGIVATNGKKLLHIGMPFVLLSALTYAVYMVMVKVSSLKDLKAETLTFYAMLFGLPVFLLALRGGSDLQKLPDLFSLGCALGLALFPSLCSFLFMAIAIKYIGPTKTAILGALEPVTALLIGRVVFGENMSWQQIIAVFVFLGSVTIVVTSKPPVSAKQQGMDTN